MAVDRRQILTLAAGTFFPAAKKAAADPVPAILQAQTQELMDAVGRGDAAPWRKYLHADCVYTSEDGEVSDRRKLLDDLKPLLAGVSGKIVVIDFHARVEGGTAITTYVSDENEDFHGHKLHCQYRSTDTWLETPAGWRLLSSQVLALRTDPPAIPLDTAKADEYCGRYALTPEIAFEIRRKSQPAAGPASGVSLEGQQTGRPVRELRAEAADVLFSPGRVRYRYVFGRDGAGKITGFAERREAWDLVWRRIA
ncbi:MAG: nuclear transport factor 2 family protein [Acidobacteriota bacterium]|nr:nuclear transport factor 2 family protein [Acidobacteriota bacterium]